MKAPEIYRIRKGPLATPPSYGNAGPFLVPHEKIKGYYFFCMVSDMLDWEHVSVSLQTNKKSVERCPTWTEMCFIKSLFWSDDEVVVQYHPAKSDYIDIHPNCLHLWKPISQQLPVPPKQMV